MATFDDMMEALIRQRRIMPKGYTGYMTYVMAFAAFMAFVLLTTKFASVGSLITFVACMATGILVVAPWLSRRGWMWMVRKWMIAAYGTDGPVPFMVALHDICLRYEMSGMEVRIKWSNVLGIDEDERYIQLKTKPTGIVLVAKRAFQSTAHVEHFLHIAKELQVAGASQQPIHPPTFPPIATT